MSRDDMDDPSYAVPAEDDGGRDALSQGAISNIGTISGNSYIYLGGHGDPHPASDLKPEDDRPTLAEQRQSFFFDFLKHSLQQAEWTFRLSVWFMAGGSAIILTAAVLGLVHAGNPDLSYLPIVTFLTGALITGGGGALAVHARRARAHVTEQADRMDIKIDLDHKMETATAFIDRVDDPAVRDRLNSAAAMKALDMQSTPEVMVDRLLPGQETRQPGEIEPGGTTR